MKSRRCLSRAWNCAAIAKKKEAASGPRNTVFLFEFDDLTICHLGDLNIVPTQAQVEEALGEVDVLLIPVGGGESLNASQASEVVSLLEPHIVIPMHYHVPDSALQTRSR